MAATAAVAVPKEAYKRYRIGKSTISIGDSIHIPRQVMSNYQLKRGDMFEWYTGTFEALFPDEELPNMIIIVVRRKADG